MTKREPQLQEPNWRKLEKLVAVIQQKLAPDAIVEHNVKRHGRVTGVERQIDVLMKQKIGQFEMLIVIDCKDYKVKVDTKGVEEFKGLVDDVGAHKGVLVSAKGFTPAAHKTAERHQIDLYRPVDTGNHKWRVKASIPVLCEHREAQIRLGISCCYNGPLTLRSQVGDIEVFSATEQSLGTVGNAALQLWNSGAFPSEPGEYTNLPVFDQDTLIDSGHGSRAPAIFTADLIITGTQYFGNLPLRKISGFFDERTGKVITNSFTTGLLNADQVEKDWLLLKDGELPPIAPVFKVMGYVGW